MGWWWRHNTLKHLINTCLTKTLETDIPILDCHEILKHSGWYSEPMVKVKVKIIVSEDYKKPHKLRYIC